MPRRPGFPQVRRLQRRQGGATGPEAACGSSSGGGEEKGCHSAGLCAQLPQPYVAASTSAQWRRREGGAYSQFTGSWHAHLHFHPVGTHSLCRLLLARQCQLQVVVIVAAQPLQREQSSAAARRAAEQGGFGTATILLTTHPSLDQYQSDPRPGLKVQRDHSSAAGRTSAQGKSARSPVAWLSTSTADSSTEHSLPPAGREGNEAASKLGCMQKHNG